MSLVLHLFTFASISDLALAISVVAHPPQLLAELATQDLTHSALVLKKSTDNNSEQLVDILAVDLKQAACEFWMVISCLIHIMASCTTSIEGPRSEAEHESSAAVEPARAMMIDAFSIIQLSEDDCQMPVRRSREYNESMHVIK